MTCETATELIRETKQNPEQYSWYSEEKKIGMRACVRASERERERRMQYNETRNENKASHEGDH